MKIASYMHQGSEAYGVVNDAGLVTPGASFRRQYPSLRALLEADALSALKQEVNGKEADTPIASAKFLPTITAPDKIACVGVNYKAHADEAGRSLPPRPSVFLRHTNTLVAHEGQMPRPRISANFDFEGELAVIIGKPGRYIPKERALEHVAGYSCFNDGSIRDYQKFSVTSGKNFPRTGPLGPWMTTADEIPDPGSLTLTTRLNGIEMQRSTTDLMIYPVPEIIAFVSEFTPLQAGDVIATGTPSGVGHRRDPQVWMKAGDVIEIEISKIGVLRNAIVNE